MTVQTTGGYNSTNNGIVESPIKPLKQMVRAMLVEAGLPDTLWYFCFIYACYILNHRWNRSIKNIPIVKWSDGNYQIDTKNLIIFGSKVYIVTGAAHKKQLQTRTEKDPWDYMGMAIDKDEL